jgi:hypothetical protein
MTDADLLSDDFIERLADEQLCSPGCSRGCIPTGLASLNRMVLTESEKNLIQKLEQSHSQLVDDSQRVVLQHSWRIRMCQPGFPASAPRSKPLNKIEGVETG